MADVVPLPHRAAGQGDLAAAAAAFLDHANLAATTRRVYRASLAALADGLDPTRPMSKLTGELVEGWFHVRYANVAPATWNRELATLRSAVAWWRAHGWLAAHSDPTAGLVRRREHPDRTLTRAQLEALWRRGDLRLRDKTLWRLLYETAARASEALNLDVADLDLANKRARPISKGGAVEWVHWQTPTARLLARLVAGRTSGPVFLADRAPTLPAPAGDLDPASGRARLSYRRAAQLFHQTTRWTLHQLRHSAATHKAEDGTNTPMLLARSRHASVRSLERTLGPAQRRSPATSRGATRPPGGLDREPDIVEWAGTGGQRQRGVGSRRLCRQTGLDVPTTLGSPVSAVWMDRIAQS